MAVEPLQIVVFPVSSGARHFLWYQSLTASYAKLGDWPLPHSTGLAICPCLLAKIEV